MDLRDSNPAFDQAKAIGDVGIPCYVREDGTVTPPTLSPMVIRYLPKPFFRNSANGM